jgi:hypothetical protein
MQRFIVSTLKRMGRPFGVLSTSSALGEGQMAPFPTNEEADWLSLFPEQLQRRHTLKLARGYLNAAPRRGRYQLRLCGRNFIVEAGRMRCGTCRVLCAACKQSSKHKRVGFRKVRPCFVSPA